MHRLRRAIRDLDPGCFAVVMATGIVSVAVVDLHLRTVSLGLLGIAGAIYVVLVAASVWRVVAFPEAVRSDLADAARSFGALTFVAATDVLGDGLEQHGWRTPAWILLGVGSVSCLVLGVLVPCEALRAGRHRLASAHVNGTWFLWIVSCQSVALLMAFLQPTAGHGGQTLAHLAVVLWCAGIVGYAVVASLVVVGLVRDGLRPHALTPPYWVAMGAIAITIVAGSRIVGMEAALSARANARIEELCLVLWLICTALVPLLIAVGVWRHVVHRIPLRYEPAFWSLVFPVGMYSVAGQYLGAVDGRGALASVGTDGAWVALVVWAVVFGAMLQNRFPRREGAEPSGR